METEKETKAETLYKISTESMLNLSLEVLKFYYESMQKRMTDLREQYNGTTERGYKLTGIYIGVITLLCSYIYMNWDITDNAVVASMTLAAGLGVGLLFLFFIIFPRYYMPMGRNLNELNPNGYAQYFSSLGENEPAAGDKLKHILKDEINALQDTIVTQTIQNRKRTFMFAFSLISTFIGIFLSFFFFVL